MNEGCTKTDDIDYAKLSVSQAIPQEFALWLASIDSTPNGYLQKDEYQRITQGDEKKYGFTWRQLETFVQRARFYAPPGEYGPSFGCMNPTPQIAAKLGIILNNTLPTENRLKAICEVIGDSFREYPDEHGHKGEINYVLPIRFCDLEQTERVIERENILTVARVYRAYLSRPDREEAIANAMILQVRDFFFYSHKIIWGELKSLFLPFVDGNGTLSRSERESLLVSMFEYLPTPIYIDILGDRNMDPDLRYQAAGKLIYERHDPNGFRVIRTVLSDEETPSDLKGWIQAALRNAHLGYLLKEWGLSPSVE